MKKKKIFFFFSLVCRREKKNTKNFRATILPLNWPGEGLKVQKIDGKKIEKCIEMVSGALQFNYSAFFLHLKMWEIFFFT
jgi:hypothetical protein